MWKTHLSSPAWVELAKVLKAKLRANQNELDVVSSTLDGMINKNAIAASSREVKQLLELPSYMLNDCEEALEQVMEQLLEKDDE